MTYVHKDDRPTGPKRRAMTAGNNSAPANSSSAGPSRHRNMRGDVAGRPTMDEVPTAKSELSPTPTSSPTLAATLSSRSARDPTSAPAKKYPAHGKSAKFEVPPPS